ncbi:MAG: VOC family protein [Synergistales bacterium]|jgi:catechol 2,3-dioxygenase
MAAFRLPEKTRIGHVVLGVTNLAESLAFWKDLLGFRAEVLEGEGRTLLFPQEGDEWAIALREDSKLPQDPGRTGLYHVAVRLPSRADLGRLLRHLGEAGTPLEGLSDHGVSEALYLEAPDGIGVEIYIDRPRESWTFSRGQIIMVTKPLESRRLLAEAEGDPWRGMPAGTIVGHVHLRVSNLDKAKAFYSGHLGLTVTQKGYPGALFFAAGDYHHHVGTNIWDSRNAQPAPAGTAGLRSFSLVLPTQDDVESLKLRTLQSGLTAEPLSHSAEGFLTRDTDRIAVGIEALP